MGRSTCGGWLLIYLVFDLHHAYDDTAPRAYHCARQKRAAMSVGQLLIALFYL